jgi:hypothetical protein
MQRGLKCCFHLLGDPSFPRLWCVIPLFLSSPPPAIADISPLPLQTPAIHVLQISDASYSSCSTACFLCSRTTTLGFPSIAQWPKPSSCGYAMQACKIQPSTLATTGHRCRKPPFATVLHDSLNNEGQRPVSHWRAQVPL